jgi:hypothetical protein
MISLGYDIRSPVPEVALFSHFQSRVSAASASKAKSQNGNLAQMLDSLGSFVYSSGRADSQMLVAAEVGLFLTQVSSVSRTFRALEF